MPIDPKNHRCSLCAAWAHMVRIRHDEGPAVAHALCEGHWEHFRTKVNQSWYVPYGSDEHLAAAVRDKLRAET